MIRPLYIRKSISLIVKVFWLNAVFSLFYWVMESVRDVIVFGKGNIFERIFYPDLMSFWMRMLVVFIFMLYSISSYNLREKIEAKNFRVAKSLDAYGLVWIGAGFGVLYWILESFRDVFVFGRGNFLQRVFAPDFMTIWMRILVIFILMLFSIYAQMSIDERRKAEEALKKNSAELEKQVRERTIELSKSKEIQLEAVGILAGGVAHEYNNTLTAIQGLTELMMMTTDEKNPMFPDLKEIRSVTKGAVYLTQQLLLFSRKNHMRMVSLDLNKLLNGLLKNDDGLIGTKIEIVTDFEPGLWTVKVDRGTIEKMIISLVANAKDSLANGGKIVIKTENVHVDESYSKDDPEAKTGPFVCLTIQDNGLGMSKETLRHIFEPFFTTKGLGKGTGLGLSVTYGIVRKHEGWIRVNSKLGSGSSFRVYLPAIVAEKEFKSNEHLSLSTDRELSERILVSKEETNDV